MNLFFLRVIRNLAIRRLFAFCLILPVIFAAALPALPQVRVSGARGKSVENPAREKMEKARERERERELKKFRKKNIADDAKGEMTGEKIVAERADEKSIASIMAEQQLLGTEKTTREILMEKGIFPEMEGPDRSNLPQNPEARSESRFPYPTAAEKDAPNFAPTAPQTIGKNFDTVTGPNETGAFPPDTMGAVGPSQFLVFLNGRIRTFGKASGAADGVLNVDSDVFFASVLTPPGTGEVSFTSDPNVRFDRLSGRWFLTIIDVTLNATTGATTKPNRVLIAVSDAASSSALTGATVWTFYQFQADTTLFADYPSLGIDASALYIGGDMFTLAGAFRRTDGYVIPKAPVITGGSLVVWHFNGFVGSVVGAGPFAPRGVDNVDPNNVGSTALGYFIGSNNSTYSKLQIRRVTDPGNTTTSPTVSANLTLTVPTTNAPIPVAHLGNTGGNNGRLDALDDRLFAAVLRNGRLWTAHNIRVDATGTASTTAEARDAIRWYEIQNLGATPSLVQSGTVYDNATTLATAQQYWIPTITVSGQGHVALGGTTAGTNFPINAVTTGRLAGDALGTMRDGPGQIAGYSNNTAFAYNPASDPGGSSGRRWGDYSFTSLDPLDDMTIWTVQEYCNGNNTYGERVAQLIAPPPASIADGPNTGGVYNVQSGLPSVNVTITGTSVNGSGFYDPGADLGGGAVPFSHITASVSGANVTVNSITYNSPTSITLNLNTVGAPSLTPDSPASFRDLTITNPDGQAVTRSAIINVTAPTAATAAITGHVTRADNRPLIGASVTLTDGSGTQTSTSVTKADGGFFFPDVLVGTSVIITPSKAGYTFNPPARAISLADNTTDVDFTATPDAAHSRAAVNDFDGDGISDYAVFRPSQQAWYILQSSTGTMRAEIFGLSTDIPVAADYDGDGKTDVAMWRSSDGFWYSRQSSDGAFVARQFGTTGDLPVTGYFDGDSKADLAVFRPGSGTWWIQDSSTNATRAVKWGLATDKLVPQDYDGDGITDIAVYRPGNGIWYVIKSSDGSNLYRQFGASEDLPVLGDYDGDGRADFTVFRPGDKTWYRLDSASSAFKAFQFGLSDDLVVAGDYDGDGKSDIGVFRRSNSNWYVNASLEDAFRGTTWGMNGDVPIVPPSMR